MRLTYSMGDAGCGNLLGRKTAGKLMANGDGYAQAHEMVFRVDGVPSWRGGSGAKESLREST
jgi:hypothetical protein